MYKYIFSLITIVVLSSVGVAFASWSGHSGNPPNNNTDVPINVSGESQTKTGHFTVGGMWVPQGRVRIGGSTVWSNEKFDVNGNIKVSGGIIFSNNSNKISSAPDCTVSQPRLGWNGSSWQCNDPYP